MQERNVRAMILSIQTEDGMPELLCVNVLCMNSTQNSKGDTQYACCKRLDLVTSLRTLV